MAKMGAIKTPLLCDPLGLWVVAHSIPDMVFFNPKKSTFTHGRKNPPSTSAAQIHGKYTVFIIRLLKVLILLLLNIKSNAN